MKKSIKLLLVLCILIPLHLFASEKQQKMITADSWELNYYERLPYKIMRPINFDSGKNYPVVICLHGASQMDADTVKFSPQTYGKQLALPQIRLDYPAYILVPKASKLWTLTDFAKMKAVIAALQSVDRSRIYIIGHSAGGQGTYLFIENEPQYFAAAIADAAYGDRIKNKAAIINFNLWSMHGDADKTVPYKHDSILFQNMKALNARMKFTTYYGYTHGQSDQQMFGINGIDTAVVPLTAGQFKTETAGPDADPETNTLIWLFSKRSNSSLTEIPSQNKESESLIINQTNSTLTWSSTTKMKEVTIYDLKGSLKTKISKPTNNTLDISSLQNGLYLVKFYDENSNSISRKIIVR